MGGLSTLAIERAHEHMKNRPQFLTKIGKRRLQTIDQELFPGIAAEKIENSEYEILRNQKLF
jgi:23S rRNA G2445 N2-methylase RlmL